MSGTGTGTKHRCLENWRGNSRMHGNRGDGVQNVVGELEGAGNKPKYG